jgi:hypothetical protein
LGEGCGRTREAGKRAREAENPQADREVQFDSPVRTTRFSSFTNTRPEATLQCGVRTRLPLLDGPEISKTATELGIVSPVFGVAGFRGVNTFGQL